MKTRQSHLSAVTATFMIAVTTVLFAEKAGGQVQELPFGSMEKVENYAVQNVNSIIIFSWYFNNTNNSWKPFINSGWYAPSPLTNKYEMDQIVIAWKLSNILNALIIHTNQSIVKSKGIQAYVDCSMAAGGDLSQASFNTPAYVFIPPTNISGTYAVPNLSWFKTKISDKIPVYVPGLRWARLETGLKDNPEPFEVNDRRLSPGDDVLHSDGFMYLYTSVIANSSKTNGDYWLKLSLLTKDFQSFDGDGKLIPETPFRTKIGTYGDSIAVTISGGDSGRGYYLQQSPDQRNWVNCSPITFVSPLTHIMPQGDIQSFVYQTTNTMMFFRTVTTNVVPY